MNAKLIITGINGEFSEFELREMFSKHGKVIDTDIPVNRLTGRNNGFGYVIMSSLEEAEKAIKVLNGSFYGVRKLTVKLTS